jgi:hypothetical protein
MLQIDGGAEEACRWGDHHFEITGVKAVRSQIEREGVQERERSRIVIYKSLDICPPMICKSDIPDLIGMGRK